MSLMLKQVKPRRTKAATSKRKKTATAATVPAADSASSITTVRTADSGQYCSVIGMKLAAVVKHNQIAVTSNDASAAAGDAVVISQLLLTVLRQQQLLPAGVTVEIDVKNGYMNFNTLKLQCDGRSAFEAHDSSTQCKEYNTTAA